MIESCIVIVFATLVASLSKSRAFLWFVYQSTLITLGLIIITARLFHLAGVTSCHSGLTLLLSTACTRLPSMLWAYSRHWPNVVSFVTHFKSSCLTSECLLWIKNRNLTTSSEFANLHCLAKSFNLYMKSDLVLILLLSLNVVPIVTMHESCYVEV